MKNMIEILINITTEYWMIGFIVLLNILSNTLGTLKSIFVIKYGGWATYVIVTLNALIYALVLKSFSTSGTAAIVAYVLGHIFGYALGNYISKKIALGIDDVKIYVSDYKTMIDIQNDLLENGFSSTCEVGIIDDTTSRYSIDIQTSKRKIPELISIFKSHGINNPTLRIHEISNVSGKIAQRI